MANIKLNYKLSVYTKLGLQDDFIKEAPSDDILYGRQNGEWVEIKNTSSDIPDLTNYITTEELKDELSNYIDKKSFDEQTNEFITKTDLDDYATSDQLNKVKESVTNVNETVNNINTEINSFNETYLTKTVAENTYLTQHDAQETYVDRVYLVTNYISNAELDNKDFVTTQTLNTKNYVTETSLSEKNFVDEKTLGEKGFVNSEEVDSLIQKEVETQIKEIVINPELDYGEVI